MIPREMIQNKGSPDTVANESQSQVDSKRGKGDGPSHIAEQLWPLAVPIDSVNPDPSNARQHDEKNLEAIKASLSRFGQRSPIIVQREGMTVRAGNGRLLAARSLGWKQIAAVVVDESSIDAVAFAIADNRTAELATWNNETLAQLLDTMPKDVMPSTGFSEEDLAALLSGLNPSFGPALIDDQGRLDEIQPIVCPECGHQWQR